MQLQEGRQLLGAFIFLGKIVVTLITLMMFMKAELHKIPVFTLYSQL